MAFNHSSVTLPGRFSDAIIRQRVNTLKIRDHFCIFASNIARSAAPRLKIARAAHRRDAPAPEAKWSDPGFKAKVV
jgi:hypothetical protein